MSTCRSPTDTGGGYKVKTAVAGEWLRYSVNVATAGTYTLTVRVTSIGRPAALFTSKSTASTRPAR